MQISPRNVQMAEKIEEVVQNENKPFIAIGYLHFAGESGLLSLLEEKGYTVAQIHGGERKSVADLQKTKFGRLKTFLGSLWRKVRPNRKH